MACDYAVLAATTPSDDSSTTPVLPDAGDVVNATVDTLAVVLATGLGLLAGLLASFIVQGMLRFVVRRHPLARTTISSIASPLKALFAVIGAWIGMNIGWKVPDGDTEPALRSALHHTFLVLVIIAATWFVAAFFDGVERTILARMHESGESRYRKVQTQLQIIHRIVIVVIWVLGFALVLMTFPGARTLGTTLFTSAGVLSVVLGIAAQSTLGNVFAGLQLAFSDSIRMGDIVIWQQEFTTVEEITLTYVVLKVWDGRRLIVPSSQMTSTTFENWTRRTPDLLGYVDFELDWSAPIPQMRAELKRILARTDLWDGDTGILQVRDATQSRLQISVLLSAENASKLTDLKYYVREHMVRWIQDNAPNAVPHTRVWSSGEPSEEELRSLDGSDASVPEGQGDGRTSSLSPRPEESTDSEQDTAPAFHESHPWRRRKPVDDVPEQEAPRDEAETTVMSLTDIEKELPHRVSVKDRGPEPSSTEQAEGHESSIFTGSVQAEKRAEAFAGPGEAVLKEREKSLERQKAAATGKNPTVAAESPTQGKKPTPQSTPTSSTQEDSADIRPDQTAIMGATDDE